MFAMLLRRSALVGRLVFVWNTGVEVDILYHAFIGYMLSAIEKSL